MDPQDKISAALFRTCDILLLKSPERSLVGVSLGVTLELSSKLFKPFLDTVAWLSLEGVRWWHFIGFGVFIANLPTFFWLMSTRTSDEDLMGRLSTVTRAMDQHNIYGARRNQIVNLMIANFIDNRQLHDDFKQQLDELNAQVTERTIKK